MEIMDICKARIIRKIDIKTPLIVPSFSSKGFPKIIEIYDQVKEHLVDSSLISAFDLHHNLMPGDKEIYASDVLFIDSGGYEKRGEYDLAELYRHKYIPSDWSLELYETQLDKLNPLSKLVIVNFDEVDLLESQIKKAHELFAKYPDYAHDFLFKPSSNNNYINIEELIGKINSVTDFDILGLTESELGESIQKRCANILRIRQEMIKNDIQIPIHIFGCVDPLSILAYFLCGADIFDGLLWLRLSFNSIDGLPIYNNSYAINQGRWTVQDNRLRLLSYGRNLEVLSILNAEMCKFIKTYNWDILNKYSVKELRSIAETVGLSI